MPFRYRQLRRRCEAVLEEIRIPRSLSAEGFCAYLAELRGRPLYLHPLPDGLAGPHAYGLWLGTGTDDHIFVASGTSRPHWEHILMHEIAHMLFNHHSLDGTDGDALPAGLFADIGPRTVQRYLSRAVYNTRQEQEAELLASLLRTAGHRGAEEPPATPLGGLEVAFGFEPSCGR
ncbi:hypothetical protein FCH28_31450 [Streptomyces piniterrae]|uniref:ImmA/IrrE family metallo-endopeptidase n=1 Tax=Streptomyces piniterrae TaxID=2571125 RepID=A0A4U0MT27_9ACTN|nr:hypothetical protein [Streptomyces piniterrae]TJZ44117.1 hypothetical protein FCH28_31450 [Streptomyces piniterrae]